MIFLFSLGNVPGISPLLFQNDWSSPRGTTMVSGDIKAKQAYRTK